MQVATKRLQKQQRGGAPPHHVAVALNDLRAQHTVDHFHRHRKVCLPVGVGFEHVGSGINLRFQN